jgi:hypothetical protein
MLLHQARPLQWLLPGVDAPDDIVKTAFHMHHSHFELLVMAFGLTNTPSTFQALMNDVLP